MTFGEELKISNEKDHISSLRIFIVGFARIEITTMSSSQNAKMKF